MKGRLTLAAMLAGSATFLVSLYFDWLKATQCYTTTLCVATSSPVVTRDIWSGFGQVAAVLALALAAGAIAAAVDTELATRLPIGRVAVALGIFAVLSVAELWGAAVLAVANGTRRGLTIGLGPAAYIGLAGVGVACAGAVGARSGAITRPRSAAGVAGQAITLALIASFVLPVLDGKGALDFPDRGGSSTFICVFACLGLLAWGGRRPGPRLATAVAIGTLVAAGLLPFRHWYALWPYEAWLLVGSATGLLALGLAGSSALQIRRPRGRELVVVTGSLLLLGSLFLPWQSATAEGRHYSQRGWSTAELAGVFALGLLLALIWAGHVVHELAIGAAIFVLVAGLNTATLSASDLGLTAFSGFHFGYGAPLGFAGAALLVVFGSGRFHALPRERLPFRLASVLAALVLLAFAVTPNLLTVADLVSQTGNLFALQSPFVTLSIIGALTTLLTLRLLLRWFDGGPEDYADTVGLPLALLALTTLAVIHDATVTTTIVALGFDYGTGFSWQGWVAVFLCLLLVACGWVVRRGGYRPPRTEGSASTTSLATSP